MTRHKSWNRCLLVFIATLLLVLTQSPGCHGDDKPIQHLILLDDLPVSLERSSPLVFNIRSDYKGVVEFQESDRFQVLMNITAPSVGEAYLVHHEVVHSQGGLLLQVYKAEPTPWISSITMSKVVTGIVVVMVIVLVLCLLTAVWWYKTRRASEDLWKDRGLDDSAQQQPLMYRSRNSMQLATQSGDMMLCGGEEGEPNTEEVLHHVPEMPEDEDDSIPMEEMKPPKKRSPQKHLPLPEGRSSSSEDEDFTEKINVSKERFESPARKIHADISKKKRRKKKRDENTQNGAMDYSDQSSDWSHQDESDGERANQLAAEKEREANCEYTRTPSKGNQMTTFRPPIGRNTLQKSDGELYNTGGLRRYENMHNLPNSVSGLVSPIDERKDFLSNQAAHRHVHSASIEKGNKSEPPVRAQGPRAFSNQIYSSREEENMGKLLPHQEVNHIYVSDVPPSYASHSQYPVHEQNSKLPGEKMAPGLTDAGYVPKSPNPSNKDTSFTSDSGRSASIADSSDIFDDTMPPPMFYDITDSDVEIPPIDVDDFPSSYMPGSLRLQQKLAESPEKKTKKPQKTIIVPRTASGKEPPPTLPKLVTFQSSNSSPLHRIGECPNSPPLPPPPPPPHLYDNKQTSKPPSTGSGNPPAKQNGGQSAGVGSRGAPSALRNIHVAIVSSLCLLGLVTGVYSQMSSQTEVKLLVLAPPGFLSNKSSVYFNKNQPGEVHSENIQSSIQWFEVPSARLLDVNSTRCDRNHCSQGCDANDGNCICWRGFTMSDGRCVDVDECYEGWAKCSPYASCRDTQGSYRCVCGDSYYGNGITCEACKTPCMKGTYEVQPCSAATKQQKICKACTEVCREGYYLNQACTPDNDAICRMCPPKCANREYEYTVCYGNQNRQCKEKKIMPQAESSDNVLVEDLTDVKDYTFGIRDDGNFDLKNNNTFEICRGSNLSVKIELKELRINPQFEPVDFTGTVERSVFPGQPRIISSFCPRPLPKYYKLRQKVYKDVIYKVGQTCTHGSCRTEPKACETFRSYGKFPKLQRKYGEFTLVCTESGPLTHLFGVNQELTATTSFRAEVSNRCNAQRADCDECARECAHQVSLDRGHCKAIGDDGDNGWSPRLQACYTCCVEPRCMDVCQNYTISGCNPEMCHKGSLVEFQMEPVYPRATSEFYCNVQPIKHHLLARFDYSVLHKGQPLDKKSVSVYADDDWMINGHTMRREKFMDLEFHSHLHKIPDIIAGDISTPTYSAGMYRSTGDPLLPTGQSSINLLPKVPFGITPGLWRKNSCSDDVAAAAFKADKNHIPFVNVPEFIVQPKDRKTFSISNSSSPSQLELRLDRHMSVFGAIYPHTTVVYETLTGKIVHKGSHWMIQIQGQITTCPGVLSVNVSDSSYRHEPLFMYDLLVRCPRSFSLTSRLPTGDPVSMGRDFTISVRDANKTIHLMLHRPVTPVHSKVKDKILTESADQQADNGQAVTPERSEAVEHDFPFSVPFITAVCGAIVLLLFMAAFGILITPGEPNTAETSHFQFHHLVFAVLYFAFQFFYCLIISLTTFVLIWIAMNSESASFIQQYRQQTALQKALNSLELDRMQHHLVVEMRRQNEEANMTKSLCDLEIRKIITEVEEKKKALSMATTPDLWKKMSDKIMKHTKKVLTDFTEQINRSRDNFNYYANYVMDKLVFDIQQSYVSLASSRWLDGARFLHGAVRNLRTLLKRLDTRPFMEWLGLDSSFSQFSVGIDLSMPMPPMPNIHDFLPESISSGTKGNSESATSSFISVPPITHVYNLWFNGESHNHMAPVYRTVGKQNITAGPDSGGGLSFQTEVTIFLILMVSIDVLWLMHRSVKAYRVSRLLLCGYPLYMDCSENTEQDQKSQQCPMVTCCVKQKENATKRLVAKTLSSHFIPKLVAMVMVCLFVYVTMVLSAGLVRKETLAAVGYYNDVEHLLKLNEKMINKRLESNAKRINTVEYPAYQDLLNMYIKRHLVLLEMTKRQHAVDGLSEDEVKLPPFTDGFSCKFPVLQPKLYSRKANTEDVLIDRHADPLLQAVRKLITDSCFLILLYLAIVVLKQLLGMVLWLYVKRAGLIHLWVIYETNADEICVRER